MANVAQTTPLGGAHVDRDELAKSPTYQAYQILHLAFVVAPVVAGLDKFLHLLTDWDAYVAPAFRDVLGGPGGAHVFMLIVGVVEIAAGVIVALRPRIGAYVVAGWLVAIMVNLLATGHYFDVALRDLGLCLAALALGRLAVLYDAPSPASLRARAPEEARERADLWARRRACVRHVVSLGASCEFVPMRLLFLRACDFARAATRGSTHDADSQIPDRRGALDLCAGAHGSELRDRRIGTRVRRQFRRRLRSQQQLGVGQLGVR